MADRNSLRLAATLMFIGLLLYAVASFFHAMIDSASGSASGNDHAAIFTAISHGGNWTAVHLAQFMAIAILAAGLLVFSAELDVNAGRARWANRLGNAATIVSLAVASVVYAVDGVALKQVADAWANAPAADKAARFASAEAVRWLEWGTRSYQLLMLGIALMLFAAATVSTARVPRPIGYVMGLSGIAAVVAAWLTGVEGFSSTSSNVLLVWAVLVLVWILWLLIVAWQMKPTHA